MSPSLRLECYRAERIDLIQFHTRKLREAWALCIVAMDPCAIFEHSIIQFWLGDPIHFAEHPCTGIGCECLDIEERCSSWPWAVDLW